MFQISESTNVVHFNVEGAKKTDVKVVGTFEDPWFCGRDVCEILEYSNIHQALQINVQQKNKKPLKELSEEVCLPRKHTSVLGSINFKNMSYNDGKTIYINEPGLYALILRSKAPLANQFQDFICGVVLPSIRKYGQYIHSQQLALEFEEKLMLKDKQRQEAEQALIQVRAEAEFQSRYTNKLKDMITVMKSRQKDEIIYRHNQSHSSFRF